jgi:hypothetical protein
VRQLFTTWFEHFARRARIAMIASDDPFLAPMHPRIASEKACEPSAARQTLRRMPLRCLLPQPRVSAATRRRRGTTGGAATAAVIVLIAGTKVPRLVGYVTLVRAEPSGTNPMNVAQKTGMGAGTHAQLSTRWAQKWRLIRRARSASKS